jgi:hypothetical protein
MRTLSVSRFLAISVLLLVLTGRIASANLITNGGFETGDFTGWTATPAASGSNFGVVLGNQHSGTYTAAFGAFGSDLDAISQTFATTAGTPYDLTFYLFNRNDGQTPNNEFRVSFGGVTVLDLVAAPDFGYTLYSFSAQATGSSLTLEFAGRQAVGNFFLDDVSVEPRDVIGNGVPDTGSSALLLAFALVGLAFTRRAFDFRNATRIRRLTLGSFGELGHAVKTSITKEVEAQRR